MTATESPRELLFSYGTLQLESVQIATFGRRLAGSPDALPGFVQSMVKIGDAEVIAASGKTHHPTLRFSGGSSDNVAGTVFELLGTTFRTPTSTKWQRTNASP